MYSIFFPYSDPIIKNFWVFYEVTLEPDGPPVFYGVCKYSQFVLVPDFTVHQDFDPRYTYWIRFKQAFAQKHEAINARSKLMFNNNGYMPIMNKTLSRLARKPIYCNETGQTFQTLQDVCNAHGCAPTNLSKHLRNKSGFKSVKGRTYRYK